MTYQVIDNWSGFEKERNKNFIQEIIEGETVPFIFRATTHDVETKENNYSRCFLGHNVLERIENTDWIPKPMSGLFFPLTRIVFSICEDLDLEFTSLARMSINLGYPTQNSTWGCSPHVDHLYPHTQMLIYLNDSDGDTVIFDEQICSESTSEVYDYECNDRLPVMTRVSPKKNRILLFNGSNFHSMMTPTNSLRFVLVCSLI